MPLRIVGDPNEADPPLHQFGGQEKMTFMQMQDQERTGRLQHRLEFGWDFDLRLRRSFDAPTRCNSPP
jgi:hypothetical protein